MNNKERIQEQQYDFPYHHIPSLKDEVPTISRTLGWGWDFLTYTDFIIQEIINLNPDSYLDIGCGDGYLINKLFEQGVPFSLKGIDTSSKAISFANSCCNSDEILFQKQDIFKYDERHDIVSLIEVIEHIPENILSSFLEQSFWLAKKFLIISVPTTNLPLYAKHYRHYTNSLLEEQTKFALNEFEQVKVKYLYKTDTRLKFIRRLLSNKYFEIRHKGLNKLIWKWHKKNTYYATANDGYHLIAIYRRLKC